MNELDTGTVKVAAVGDPAEGAPVTSRRRGRPPVSVDPAVLLKLRAAGKSLREISLALGVSKSTAFDLLKKARQDAVVASGKSKEGEGL